jgi:hypothetical protein
MLPGMPTAVEVALAVAGPMMMLLANVAVLRLNPGRLVPLGLWQFKPADFVRPRSCGIAWGIGFAACIVGAGGLQDRIGAWFWFVIFAVLLACGPVLIGLRNRRLIRAWQSAAPGRPAIREP